jgi:tetratricopeptide (TPR) repeat protein
VLYIYVRRYDEAAEYLRKALTLNPDDFLSHYALAYAYEGKGLYEEAAAERVKHLTLRQEAELAEMFERIYEKEGYQAAVAFLDRKIVDEELRRPRRDPYLLAYTYARLGEKEKAFQWLEQAYEERSPHLTRVRVDPDFDSIRDDPRFQDLVRRMNFPS